jgi:subtilase family serine protease
MHTKAIYRPVLVFRVLLVLLCLSEALFGQVPLKDRVVRAVDTSQLTAVEGNVHPLARAEFDQGRVEASMPMRVTMTFKMTAAQQADLDALLAAQQQRGSADYQRWLTPEEYGSRFGLSQGDINKVTGWLENAGFQVEGVPASRNMITFSGTAAQVEAALHMEMHRYIVDGKPHFANAGEPSLPAALADVVSGFRSLHNFQMKPRVLKRTMNPKFTSGQTGNHFITPLDFATIYDVTPLYQRGITGTGQKIVVVGQSDVALSDIQAFRKNSGLPPNDPTPIDSNNSSLVGFVVPGDADPLLQPGDIDEANLDVEWAGAIAFNATVIFIVGDPVKGGGVFDAINYAITHSPIPAPVISTSYGDCEANFSATDLSMLKALMLQANAEGITVLGPAGDTGPADCDFNSNPGTPVTASTLGLAVDLPGALESVTAVGGTEFAEGADAAGAFWVPAFGADVISSARSYIPEGAWNDTDIMINGVSTGLTAGGGGSSTVTPKPAWQTGTGVPNDGARDVPDISFSASSIHDGYLVCSENFNASGNPQFTTTCPTNLSFRNTDGSLTVVGGTSVGPPIMASIVALINQFTNHSQTGSGNINTVLYPLAAHLPTAFHDVQSGSNHVPFNNPCGTQTQIGYNSLAGYDLVTGLGSMDVSAVVNNWTTVTPASTGNAATSVDFSMAFTPAQLTVTRGGCGTGTLVMTRLNGFVGTPTFTCTVPSTLGTTTTCAVTPAITTAFEVPGNYREIGWWEVAGVLLAGAAFVLVSFRPPQAGDRRSPAWARLAPGFVLVTVLAIIVGCGGSSKNSNSNGTSTVNFPFAIKVPSTAPVGTGTVTVNAMIGSLNHTATINVTTQ